jgi:hypothetical protein
MGQCAADSDQGASKGGSLFLHTKGHHSKRVFFYFIYTIHYINVTYIFLLCRVKNKPCDRESDHAFILGSMDCTVQYSQKQ